MSSKDVGIRIRVEKELREAFQVACVAESRQASDVIREFMRAYADRNSGGKQTSLFASGVDGRTIKVEVAGKQSHVVGKDRL
jgi:hypothetical protein